MVHFNGKAGISMIFIRLRLHMEGLRGGKQTGGELDTDYIRVRCAMSYSVHGASLSGTSRDLTRLSSSGNGFVGLR